MTGLSERVGRIVADFYGGRLREASRQFGIPHTTLARLMAADHSPRASTLLAISSQHGTTVEWLLTGVGPEPTISAELSRRNQLARLSKERLIDMLMAGDQSMADPF
jgi:hypothetical protein